MILTETWTPDRVVGWRNWVWPKIGGGQLTSIVKPGMKWNRVMPPAQCQGIRATFKQAHKTPHHWCMCGYWSLKMDLLLTPEIWHLPMWDRDSILQLGTLGIVESWGEIIEYEHGYRAERTQIVALFDLPWAWVDNNCRVWMENDGLRTHTLNHDWEGYNHRAYSAAKTYGLPVISIEDAYAPVQSR